MAERGKKQELTQNNQVFCFKRTEEYKGRHGRPAQLGLGIRIGYCPEAGFKFGVNSLSRGDVWARRAISFEVEVTCRDFILFSR